MMTLRTLSRVIEENHRESVNRQSLELLRRGDVSDPATIQLAAEKWCDCTSTESTSPEGIQDSCRILLWKYCHLHKLLTADEFVLATGAVRNAFASRIEDSYCEPHQRKEIA